MRSLVPLCAAVAVTLTASTLCSAAFTTWTGAAGNSLWADPANWSDGVPGINDWASIGTIDTPIQLGGDRSISTLRIRGTVELIGGEISATTIRTLDISPSAAATLKATVSARAPFLFVSDFFGTVTIDGTLKGNDASLRSNGKAVFAGPVIYSQPLRGTGITLAAAGTILGVPSIDLDGGQFTLDNSAQALSGRLSPSVAVTNQNESSVGTLVLNGNAVTDVSERLASLEGGLNGAGAILTTPGANVKLQIDSLPLSPDRFFRAQANGTTTRITTATAPQQIGGTSGVELPVVRNAYAATRDASSSIQPAGFLTFDTTLAPDGTFTGFRSLRDDEYFSGIAGAPAQANVRIAGASTNSQATTINSLLIDRTGSLILDSDLTLTSGMIVSTQLGSASAAPSINGVGKLRSSLPLQLIAASRSLDSTPLNIEASIDAPSLLLGGSGIVRLSGNNTLAQGITIKGASLVVAKSQGLGTGKITWVSGGLRCEGDTTINNPLHLEQGSYSAGALSIHGSSIGIPAGKTLTINGPVTGGGILYQSNGYLRLNGGGSFFGYFGFSSLTTAPQIEVNGTWTDAGPLFSYAELYGNATIPVTIASRTVSPGPINGLGTMHIKGFGSNGAVRIDIFGAECDLLRVDTATPPTGILAYAGTALDAGRTYRVIDLVDPTLHYTSINGAAEGSVVSSLYGGVQFRISYVGGDGNDVTLTVAPEPVSLAALGLVIAMVPRSRKRE